MSDHHRSAGRHAAFLKYAAGGDPDGEGESHGVRNTLMAGAVAAPFAGLIGQKKQIHAGAGDLYDYETLMKMTQPGDVILSGDTHMSSAKATVSAATGTPKGYHVSAVPRHEGVTFHSHPGTGTGMDEAYMAFKPTSRLQVLRPKLSPQQREEFLDNMDTVALGRDGLARKTRAVLQKTHGYAKADAQEMADLGAAGLYDLNIGTKGSIKDLLLPKIGRGRSASTDADRAEALKAFDQMAGRKKDSISSGVAQKFDDHAKAYARRAAQLPEKMTAWLGTPIEADGLGGALKEKVRTTAGRGLGLRGVDSRTAMGNLPDCSRGVCSTSPAMAMPQGVDVLPGKSHRDLLPSDYLRSELFETVGRHDPKPQMSRSEKILSHGPTLSRLAIGAAGAATTYGVSKAWDAWKSRKKEGEP